MKYLNKLLFLCLITLTGVSANAQGFKKSTNGWACEGITPFTNTTFYYDGVTPTANILSLATTVGSGFNLTSDINCYGHTFYCATQSTELVRAVVTNLNSSTFSSATPHWIKGTVVLPNSKVYITVEGGSAVEMTKSGNIYTADINFGTIGKSFTITGDMPSATTIRGEQGLENDVPATGLPLYGGVLTPTSVQLNLSGLTSQFNTATVTFNLLTNQITQTIVTCTKPSNLTASSITSNSAVIGWTAGGSETSWNIEYGLSGFTIGNGTNVAGITTNSYSLTGLEMGSNYQFYVQADCGGADGASTWAGPYSFAIPCGNISSLPYSNNFDNLTALPLCFDTKTTDNASVTFKTYNGYNNSRCIEMNYGNGGDCYLILPQTSVPINTLQIGFYLEDGSDCTIKTGYFNASLTTFTEVNSIYVSAGGQNIVDEFSQVTGLSGNERIAIKYEGDDPWYSGRLDNLTINQVTCPRPTNENILVLEHTEATFAWTAGGSETSWILEYGVSGFTPGSGTVLNVSSNPYTLTGLFPSTHYEAYLKSDCGETNGTSNTLLISFITLSYENDLGVEKITNVSPKTEIDIPIKPKAIVRNYSSNQVNTIGFGYVLTKNEAVIMSANYNMSYDIAPFSSATFTFPDIVLPDSGNYVLSIQTSQQGDQFLLNDTVKCNIYGYKLNLLYDNGPFVTDTLEDGTFVSVVQSNFGLTMYGTGVYGYNRIIDEFVIPAGQKWTIDAFANFSYQTNSDETTTTTSLNAQIWNESPMNGGTLVYDFSSENLLYNSQFSYVFRVKDDDMSSRARPIMKNTGNLSDITLSAGTYWFDWQVGGTSNLTGPWASPITIKNQPETGNAIQSHTGTFEEIKDFAYKQGMPFQVFGNIRFQTNPVTMFPDSNAVEVAFDTPIQVQFDKLIDSIDVNKIFIICGLDTLTNVSASINQTDSSLINFSHNAFEPNMTYRVVFKEDAVANNLYNEEFEWSFTTANEFVVNFSVINGNGSLSVTVNSSAITSGEQVTQGSDIIFTASPNTNYEVKEWKVNNEIVAGNTSNEFTLSDLQEESNVTVEFKQITHAVNFSVINGNGSLSATVNSSAITSGEQVAQGSHIIFTASPNTNYEVKEWKVNNEIVAGNTSNEFTLTDLQEESNVTVEFKTTVGISNISENAISVYPNPTSGKLKIKNEKLNVKNVEVYDITGKVILTFSNLQISEFSDVEIDLSSSPNGVYFIKMITNNRVCIEKIIKE